MSLAIRLDRFLQNQVEKILILPDDGISEQVDLIIAVGDSLAPGLEKASPQSEAIALQTRELFHEGYGRKVLFLGSGYRFKTPTTEAVEMARIANLPKGICIIRNSSYNTRLNALEAKGFVDSYNVKSMIIVAQQLHARRVWLTFRKVFPKQKIYIRKAYSDYGGSSKWPLNSFCTFLLWEILSTVYFWLRGWV